ncbi:hypothetical protein [Providencia rettgeri]|uniref:hypothetical protein n=1 Tax=Providencia rettgeri TaxID=587 RepID=UPI001419C1A4|nr:hypothetical protein [Providencia rettgeri]NIH07150.1 hypothetical protein [Providencia rettgeri]
MYLIELNDIDLERAISDAEYFTASEDEYFSAEESISLYSIPSSSRTAYSIPPNSRTTYSIQSSSMSLSARSVTLQKNDTMPSENIKIKWTFDESGPREQYIFKKHIPVDAAGMRNYYMWRRIVLSGVHPRRAADMAGSEFCFKQVKQKNKNKLYSIRLTSKHRVFFTIQENERRVNILNIGGHSFR